MKSFLSSCVLCECKKGLNIRVLSATHIPIYIIELVFHQYLIFSLDKKLELL